MPLLTVEPLSIEGNKKSGQNRCIGCLYYFSSLSVYESCAGKLISEAEPT